MLQFILLALLIPVAFWLWTKLFSLIRNIAAAKRSGLPYRISIIDGVPGYLWIATHDIFLGTLHRFTPSRKWLWPKLAHVHRSWHYSQEMREALGEVYLIVSPGQIYMSCSDPEAIVQLTTRRRDFVKPVELYAIVDIFGPSILTTEGEEWKRHRKIVAPAFSEKSNSLVWKESLRQGLGMIDVWSKLSGNVPEIMKVGDTAPYIATMALHVICAAGFGVRQLWAGEDEDKLKSNSVAGFNTSELIGNHTLTFKESLKTLLHSIIWLAIFPVSLLKKSPFELHKKLLRAYSECNDYFSELSEFKVKQLEHGETTAKGTMDVMGPLVRASERSPEDSKELYLTKQEVIADSWIILFAGHETSANIAHFTLLFLAIDLEKQNHLQKDIDKVVGSRPSEDWSYETDLGLLWNSMIGATISETLRLMPPIIDIPKIVRDRPQPLTFDGRTYSVPVSTMIHISAVGVQRNPRYWPHSPSKLSSRSHDLDDWVPERWLTVVKMAPKMTTSTDSGSDDGENTASFDTNDGLLVPPKGVFMPFSEGARACPGRRFAQVEITAILAVIFKTYSLELDVSAWASDAEVEEMNGDERRSIYQKAMTKARQLIFASQSEIFLQMRGKYPVKFVKRGEEKFMDDYI